MKENRVTIAISPETLILLRSNLGFKVRDNDGKIYHYPETYDDLIRRLIENQNK